MSKIFNTKDTDVIILCGGKGERLRSVVDDKPKPLADVHGKPFLDLVVDHVSAYGFLRFILCTGYLGDQIEQYYSGRPIIFSREKAPLGTGGAIKNASQLIESNPFMVMNGDSLCPIDLEDFADDYVRKNARHEIVLNQPSERKDVDLIELGSRLEVTSFAGTFPSAGIYLFDKDIFKSIPSRPCSLEHDVLPTLIGNSFYGYLTTQECFDIGTPERYQLFLQNRARIG